MLVSRIIPCLDIKNGRVVKGTNFIDLKDSGDPVVLAKKYYEQGADELVLLDIVATVEERKNRVELVRNVAEQVAIPFTVGGGVAKIEHIKELLDAGADKVSIGSAAINNPDFVAQACASFGSQAIVISIDAKKVGDVWTVFVKGGREDSGEDALSFAKNMEEIGVGELLVNSLDRDGTGRGFDVELMKKISSTVNIPVIASSGAGKLSDFKKVFKETQVTAALGAGIFHRSEFTIKEVKNYLKNYGVEVR